MTYLAGAVAVVAAIAVLNLVLTVGVISRLKEHAEQLSRSTGLTRVAQPMPEAGSAVGEFAAATVDGVPVSRSILAETALVGFFTPNCPPCKEQLPEFVAYAASIPEGRSRVLAVVAGDPDDTASTVAALGEVAQVVVEDHSGPVAAAFGVHGLPAFCLIDGAGRITAASATVSDVAERVLA